MAIEFPDLRLSEACDTLAVIEAVRDYTAGIFDGEARVEVVFDPEFGDRSFLVSVKAHGTVDQLIDKSDAWHRNLDAIALDMSSLYGLSIIPLDES